MQQSALAQYAQPRCSPAKVVLHSDRNWRCKHCQYASIFAEDVSQERVLARLVQNKLGSGRTRCIDVDSERALTFKRCTVDHTSRWSWGPQAVIQSQTHSKMSWLTSTAKCYTCRSRQAHSVFIRLKAWLKVQPRARETAFHSKLCAGSHLDTVTPGPPALSCTCNTCCVQTLHVQIPVAPAPRCCLAWSLPGCYCLDPLEEVWAALVVPTAAARCSGD